MRRLTGLINQSQLLAQFHRPIGSEQTDKLDAALPSACTFYNATSGTLRGERLGAGGQGGYEGGRAGWMFNDNYAVGGTDRYHRQLQGYPPHITYSIPASKLKKLIAFIKTLLLIMFGWTSTFKYYYETPNGNAIQ